MSGTTIPWSRSRAINGGTTRAGWRSRTTYGNAAFGISRRGGERNGWGSRPARSSVETVWSLSMLPLAVGLGPNLMTEEARLAAERAIADSPGAAGPG